jgi:hypothetical protein
LRLDIGACAAASMDVPCHREKKDDRLSFHVEEMVNEENDGVYEEKRVYRSQMV